ncbi:PilZ domain-containing protein [Colwellia sp. E2M01]|uniref:PilZ domain-containing protein n=1 Tax=Colwellia sp. E2M01 TaxID=2841561 RepID=UPI001C082993|nr:PilZ domain-containing protein [Colwellia sp. E2M01]MBU2869287.1 PilZ domain-containing protein [Colwellia sp. E2M01]
MNKDFSKHYEIINNLRGEVNKKGFEPKYNAATEHLSKNERFLLKMELKRLASPCTRAIDLRGLVKGDCQFFDFQGQSHFLDEVAIAAFKESVGIYGGYTFGVYEDVKDAKNSFRNIYENEQIKPSTVDNVSSTNKPSVEKLQYTAKLHLLSNYPDRAEERMNYAIPITLKVHNQREISTTSIDISVRGIKFKLINEMGLYKGDVISIAFTGLEQEFQFTKDSLFTFEVKNVKRDSGTQIIGCKRINISDNDAFERFLIGYIQGNKRRYKINLDNTLAALQSRSFEQFSLVKVNELPIFLQNKNKNKNKNNNSETFLPRYALTTKNNNKQYQYWKDDKNQSALHFLINPERLQYLLECKEQGKSLLVFSFFHENKGNKFFYTLDEQHLKEDKVFFKQFLAFAATKESFAVTALNIKKVDTEHAYSPFTLSNTATKQEIYLNPPVSNEVNQIIKQLPYIVTAIDITDKTARSDYKSLGATGIDPDKLKRLGCKVTATKTVDEIVLSYGHQRQEMRFKYETPVTIECESVKWSGTSADFSVSGMKINLASPATLSKDDIVYLSFPKLQKITSEFDLSNLPYKVIRVNKDKTEINLRVSVKEHQHIGRSFFKLLINKNKNKLTPDEYAMLTPGLSDALRTLYAVNMSIPSAIVQSSGSRYKVESLVAGQYGLQNHNNLLADMLRLSDRRGYYNLYPLLSNLGVRNLLDQYMKKLLATDSAINEQLYIAIKTNITDVESSVEISRVSELKTAELRHAFIKEALKQGRFYSVDLKLSRSDEAHMEYLNPELAYVSSYAIHRGKQIEQEIYSVAGLVQLVDSTQEALLRHILVSELDNN